MKKSTSSKTKLLLVALAIGTAGAPGCKSLSWKPGGKLFAWNRQPESESLALPESPATKYSPDAIASIGSQSGPQSAAAGTGSAPSTAYGYSSGSSAVGLAAKANGYQTGPYQVGGAKPAAETATAGGSSSVNPYGGSYGKLATGTAGSSSTTPKTPDISLPSSVQAALAANKTSPANQPNTQVTAGTKAGLPTIPVSGTNSAYASSSLPKYPQIPSQTGSAGSTASRGSYQGTTTLGQNPVAGLPVGAPSAGMTAASNGMPAASGVAGTTASSATASSATMTAPSAATPSIASPNAYTGEVQKAVSATEAFAPGTTGRSTKYDFSK